MQQSLEAMNAALRVLTALSENRRPDALDVADLERFAGETPHGESLDEFTCSVIQKALQHRAARRKVGGAP